MSRLSEQVRNAVPLWDEHLQAPFPAGLRGVESGGTDLVLLDAETAGCVLTWLNNGGTLDPERTRVLRSRIEDLDRVIPEIPDSAGIQYCQRLRRLALRVSATLSGAG
ncbi:hypothetical protein RM550_18315 [Streptomyces sp. DSM 41527]|uniref:Uncharacterized protein n=1 Tax=Streptomyces mooreae TaxID=3075523 RepID=A0ABU2T9P1_9ACTN|nr:hypothetical protein [Streptomyces sp. DSM 41527]MDT0457670.1 hypothetical protein [Streptomyces sp. DSM 41527]